MELNNEPINNDQELKLSLETFKSTLDSTIELINEGFLSVGTRFGLGHLNETPSMDMLVQQVEDADAWMLATEVEKKGFLRNVIIELGLTPENLTRERAEQTYDDEGFRGEPNEAGSEIMVFKTKYAGLELHVLDYRNPDIGRRYDLVVSSTT